MSKIAFSTFFRWIFHLNLIINSKWLIDIISYQYEFIILNKIFCPILGYVLRCKLALYLTFLFFFLHGHILFLLTFNTNKKKKNSIKLEFYWCIQMFFHWLCFYSICIKWVNDNSVKEIWEKKFYDGKVSLDFFFSLIRRNIVFSFFTLVFLLPEFKNK